MGTSWKRLCAEIGAAGLCAAVAIATLIEPQWFERLFDASPDDGDGSFETLVVVAIAALAAAIFAVMPLRRRMRQQREAAATPKLPAAR